MKKLLSAFLVLVMILSLPGVGALAASGELTWSLDKKGTLTISGNGDMPNYSDDTPPWEKYKDDIKAVVIENGVTHIGTQSFQYCTNLKSVTIPSSVESIGKAAFFRCEKLSEITLPGALVEIEAQTFDHCTKLKSIVIPDSVFIIGKSAFNCCASLETVDLPASVEKIRDSAFNGCDKLETVYYSGTADDWKDIEIERYNRPLTGADLVVSDSEASSDKPVARGKLK